eukprot:gene6012-5888_t
MDFHHVVFQQENAFQTVQDLRFACSVAVLQPTAENKKHTKNQPDHISEMSSNHSAIEHPMIVHDDAANMPPASKAVQMQSLINREPNPLQAPPVSSPNWLEFRSWLDPPDPSTPLPPVIFTEGSGGSTPFEKQSS